MSRKIIVASSLSNNAKRIESSATTLGELKSEISELVTSGVEFVVRPGNVTLRDDSSVLPEGEFRLFIIPSKNKSGWEGNYEDEDFGELEDAIVAAIEDAADKIVAAIKGSKVEKDEELSAALDELNEI